MSKVYVIIVAAGKSQRFGRDKLWADLGGRTVLERTVKAFSENKNVDKIIVVTNKEKIALVETLQFSISTSIGGKTRQQSSFNGLKSLKAKPEDIVIFHNGANPLVTQKEINSVIEATKKNGAAVVGRPIKNTIKIVETPRRSISTADRQNLYEVQTPQGIRYDLAMQAFTQAEKDGFTGTDDVQLVERLGNSVKIVPVSSQNFKITEKEDLELANLILNQAPHIKQGLKQIFVGIGQDSHRFDQKTKHLVLGGLKISSTGGLQGNSDGDVILHALCNALSSATGGFSLSNWSDKMCQFGVTDSQQYLQKIHQEILNKGFRVNNLSIALEASKPKLEKHLPQIQKSLANLLKIKPQKIGLTVTSGEGLTNFGKGKGIQCFCFVSLKQA